MSMIPDAEPTTLPLQPETIPTALRRRLQWVCWQWAPRPDGTWTKEPINPRTGTRASSNDPATWAPFDIALAAAQSGRAGGTSVAGIGYVFSEHDPYAGIDLDHVDKYPELLELAGTFATYAERSPSGAGLHLILEGHLPIDGSGKRSGPVEVYQHSRYFTVTGHRLPGVPVEPQRCDDAMAALWSRLFGEPAHIRPTATITTPGMSDREILERASNAKNGDRFRALYDRGDTSAYGGDDSAADLALLSLLAFWTQDRPQLARLFAGSMLGQREKWKRPDYQERTIDRALDRDEVYQPGSTATMVFNGQPPERRGDAGTEPIEVQPKGTPMRAGYEILDDVSAYLGRFVAYPTDHARVAHTLWIAHTHLMDAWDSTPRLAFLSPEPGSGKTRALEVSELLVPRPVEAVNMSAAALFRIVAADGVLATVLYDEVDTVFANKRTAEQHEDVRGLLNAGHRRGQKAYRCVMRGKDAVVVEYEAYAAVALAGLGDLPDTILTRSVIIRMRRRAPGEHLEPFRRRLHRTAGHALRDALAAWAASVAKTITATWPEMPAGIEDRDADVWEALLAVADAAGGDWTQRAREAAVALVTASRETTPSLGIRLLADLRQVFGDRDAMHSDSILKALIALDEAPWGELAGGKPLNARGLAKRLGQYGVKSKNVREREGDQSPRKGYSREDLADAWSRYLPPTPDKSTTAATSVPDEPSSTEITVDAGGSGDHIGGTDRTSESATASPRHAGDITDVADVTHFSEDEGRGDNLRPLRPCVHCGGAVTAPGDLYCDRHAGRGTLRSTGTEGADDGIPF